MKITNSWHIAEEERQRIVKRAADGRKSKHAKRSGRPWRFAGDRVAIVKSWPGY